MSVESNNGQIVSRNEGQIVPRNEGRISILHLHGGERIISRISPQENFSGAPYVVSDTIALNLGVSPDNNVVSRLSNVVTVWAIPFFVQDLLGNVIGLGTRQLLGGTANAIGTVSHVFGSVADLFRGRGAQARLHAAQAASHAYNTALNGLVICGIYLIPALPIIESVAAVGYPRIRQNLFNRVSDAPNGIFNYVCGIEKPYLLPLQDGKFPITAEEKQKIESGELKYYKLLLNEGKYEIKFLSREEAIEEAEIRRTAAEETLREVAENRSAAPRVAIGSRVHKKRPVSPSLVETSGITKKNSRKRRTSETPPSRRSTRPRRDNVRKR